MSKESIKKLVFPKKEAADLVDLVFKVIKDTLARGEKVKISGFGNFSIRDKANRVGRNPQTGDAMEISARRVLTFKPSQVLKEDITSRYSHRLDDKGNEDTSQTAKRALRVHLVLSYQELKRKATSIVTTKL